MENFKKNCKYYIKQNKIIIENHYHIYERNIDIILFLLYRLTEEPKIIIKICMIEFYKEILKNIPEI